MEKRQVVAMLLPRKAKLAHLRMMSGSDQDLRAWTKKAFDFYQQHELEHPIGRIRYLEFFGGQNPRICASTRLSVTNKYTLWWLKGQELINVIREVWEIRQPSDTMDLF